MYKKIKGIKIYDLVYIVSTDRLELDGRREIVNVLNNRDIALFVETLNKNRNLVGDF